MVQVVQVVQELLLIVRMGVLVQLAQALHSDHGLVLAQAALAVQAKNLETLELVTLLVWSLVVMVVSLVTAPVIHI